MEGRVVISRRRRRPPRPPFTSPSSRTGVPEIADERYHSSKFEPGISFEVGAGWKDVSDYESIVFLDAGSPPELAFLRVGYVWDARTQFVEKGPHDLPSWLQRPQHSNLKSPPTSPSGVYGGPGS